MKGSVGRFQEGYWRTKELSFATNSYFLIPLSLQPNAVDLWYFELLILLDQIITIWVCGKNSVPFMWGIFETFVARWNRNNHGSTYYRKHHGMDGLEERFMQGQIR